MVNSTWRCGTVGTAAGSATRESGLLIRVAILGAGPVGYDDILIIQTAFEEKQKQSRQMGRVALTVQYRPSRTRFARLFETPPATTFNHPSSFVMKHQTILKRIGPAGQIWRRTSGHQRLPPWPAQAKALSRISAAEVVKASLAAKAKRVDVVRGLQKMTC